MLSLGKKQTPTPPIQNQNQPTGSTTSSYAEAAAVVPGDRDTVQLVTRKKLAKKRTT